MGKGKAKNHEIVAEEDLAPAHAGRLALGGGGESDPEKGGDQERGAAQVHDDEIVENADMAGPPPGFSGSSIATGPAARSARRVDTPLPQEARISRLSARGVKARRRGLCAPCTGANGCGRLSVRRGHLSLALV